MGIYHQQKAVEFRRIANDLDCAARNIRNATMKVNDRDPCLNELLEAATKSIMASRDILKELGEQASLQGETGGAHACAR